MPVNEQKVSDFKTRLKDVNWTKQYIPEANIIHMKERNMIDGLEYEITPSGKVTEVGCWVKPTVILEKDKDAAALFNKNDANAKGGKLKHLKKNLLIFGSLWQVQINWQMLMLKVYFMPVLQELHF